MKKGLNIKKSKGKGTPPTEKKTENLNVPAKEPKTVGELREEVMKQRAKQEKKGFPSDKFVALNFKVDPNFRKAFRGYASDQDIPMKDLLEKCFEYYKANH